jgi:hypothetical protein
MLFQYNNQDEILVIIINLLWGSISVAVLLDREGKFKSPEVLFLILSPLTSIHVRSIGQII